MGKLYTLIFSAVFYSFSLHCQNMFQLLLGSSQDELPVVVFQNADGGYTIGGTYRTGSSNWSGHILRTDYQGNAVFNKTYQSTGELFRSVAPVSSGGYIAGGSSDMTGDMYLVRTDANGGLLWSKKWKPISSGIVCAIQSADGNIVFTSDVKISNDYASLTKTDLNGNILWSKHFGEAGFTSSGVSVQQTIDGGYIVFANPATLVKTDNNGGFNWKKQYSVAGATNLFFKMGKKISNGGYIVTGSVLGIGAGSTDAFILKTDSDGLPLWFKTYGSAGTDEGTSVSELGNGTFLIKGETGGFGAGSNDLYLLSTDADGTTNWFKAYGGTGYDYDYEFDRGGLGNTNDGGFVFTGTTDGFGAAGYDIYLIKADAYGYSGCNEAFYSPSVNSFSPAYSNQSGTGVVTHTEVVHSTSEATRGITRDPLCALLPVTFTHVNGYLQQQNAVLEWSMSEQVTGKFIIEKLNNSLVSGSSGITYETAGTLLTGSVSSHTFTYAVENIDQGVNYYRIKYSNTDGPDFYSAVIEIQNSYPNNGIIMDISPNPCSAENPSVIRISIPENAEKNDIRILVFNLSGKQLYDKKFSALKKDIYSVTLPCRNIETGLYFVQLKTRDIHLCKKLIVQ